jgi:hypothetical protein
MMQYISELNNKDGLGIWALDSEHKYVGLGPLLCYWLTSGKPFHLSEPEIFLSVL